jgi:hypothetical protein
MAVVMRCNEEFLWRSMAAKSDGEDEAGEFPFKCHQRLMAWCYWVAEESHRVLALEENGAKPIDGGIALHDEGLLEVGEGEYEHCTVVTACLREENALLAPFVQANPSFFNRTDRVLLWCQTL